MRIYIFSLSVEWTMYDFVCVWYTRDRDRPITRISAGKWRKHGKAIYYYDY